MECSRRQSAVDLIIAPPELLSRTQGIGQATAQTPYDANIPFAQGAHITFVRGWNNADMIELLGEDAII